MEGLGDLGVHRDLEVVLDLERLVALSDHHVHPVGERLADHAVDDVAEPLPVQAGVVLGVR